MKNSIAWHDTFPEKYRVTKVVLQHVFDWKIKKKLKTVFVKVSTIIMVFFVIICVICGLNCPIHPWGPGHWNFQYFLDRFLCQKISVFGIRCSLRFTDFPSFSIWFPALIEFFCSFDTFAWIYFSKLQLSWLNQLPWGRISLWKKFNTDKWNLT